ncbi:glycoside hydrolase [Pseudoclavibacter sp. AY1F1]|uniref:glycosyl hydrolase n=1 Tax=Pseudoclavibacter sp. AY1F1 TaxID=2080583 RepID=UPI000CE8FDB0|nr:glycosyl hydrolase [Pseudoclavibacter sp. AY1F1]PPF43415.1 glycoside hydrolase [Pseudoclavibacter sp. AY1F1]
MTERHHELWNAFVQPPDDARPRAWWHWMDGNVDPDGIDADLRWLHAVGIRGVQAFDGALGNPLVVPDPVIPGTGRWRDAIGSASATARGLGLEFTVATSAGWSASGAPWVSADDAMRKLVWSQTVVDGGTVAELAPLPDVAGPFQEVPKWRSDAGPGSGHVKDLFVLAVPFNPAHDALEPESIVTSAVSVRDGVMEAPVGSVRLERDPDEFSTAWIEQHFDEPVTVRSCVIVLPGPHGFGAAPAVAATLQVQDEDGEYIDATSFPVNQCPSRTASFAPVSGRAFRLLLSADGIRAVSSAFERGVRPPPIFQPLSEFIVDRFELFVAGKPAHVEAKSGFATSVDYDVLDTDPQAAHAVVPSEAIIDLSGSLSGDRLTEALPAGRWRIIRFGSSLTGQTNGPALPEATGLEVDKLDAERVRAYITRHLDQFGDAEIDALLSDSIEAGLQNITDRLVGHFVRLRGYNPVPWLLATAGFQVESVAATDLFLSDFRRTIAEVFADAYYGTLADEAHQRGMTYYAEALEDRRPQLGDDLAMRSHADVPMGAMWTFDSKTGPAPSYVADLKGASSVAHVHQRAHTGSEAFTSGRNPWSDSPKSLKHVADLQLTLGVTRFCIHSSPHQPSQVPPPGLALAPSLGQAFTRNETWAHVARPWIDYLARCSHLLSQGRPAVDVAFFIGEEAPVTGLYGDHFDEHVPRDYDFDYIGPDALSGILEVADGVLSAGSSRYRVLYLGGSSDRMSTRALENVLRLVEAGATVVGMRPALRSLADDSKRHAKLCEQIWGQTHSDRVHATRDLGEVLRRHFLPLLVVPHTGVRRIARWLDGELLVFLANAHEDPVATTISLPGCDRPLVAWDPVALERRELRPTSDGTGFELSLAPYGSVFVLPGGVGDGTLPSSALVEVPVGGEWTTTVPGAEPIRSAKPILWTELGDESRRFSGTVQYRFEFDLPEAGHPVPETRRPARIRFGDISDIAEVTINGIDAGIVWTAPFELPACGLRQGRNVVELRVTNPWRNRLIAEGQVSSGSLFEPMTRVFDDQAELLPAGVVGPVTLVYDDTDCEHASRHEHERVRHVG